MLRAEYTTQFKKNLKLARLRCHDLGADSKAPDWIVPNVLHRAPHTGGVTPPAKVTSNRVGARSPSAPHSGGDAARLGKVRLQDELPNCGNRPCKAACRARHAEVTDEGGTAALHLASQVHAMRHRHNLEIAGLGNRGPGPCLSMAPVYPKSPPAISYTTPLIAIPCL